MPLAPDGSPAAPSARALRDAAKPFEGEILRRTLPRQLEEALAVTLEKVRINAEAERWAACHAAIDLLAVEALEARCWTWPVERRLAASPEMIGVSGRTANALFESGLYTVADLLHASRPRLLAIRNLREKAIEECTRCLRRLFRDDLSIVLGWPEE